MSTCGLRRLRRYAATSLRERGYRSRMTLPPASITPEQAQRVRDPSWCHTIDSAPGLTTDGWFDLRAQVPSCGLPERMDGMRVLDIGTWDGFWAFAMQRRAGPQPPPAAG